MATQKEQEQEQANATQLYKLLLIKQANQGQKNKQLEIIIGETKAGMSKESIAWVEKQVDEHA